MLASPEAPRRQKSPPAPARCRRAHHPTPQRLGYLTPCPPSSPRGPAPDPAAVAFGPRAVLAVPFTFRDRPLRESAEPEKIRGRRFSPSRSDLVTRR